MPDFAFYTWLIKASYKSKTMNRLKVLFWGSICLAPAFLFAQITETAGKLLRAETYRNYTGGDSTAFQRTLYDYPLPTQRVETSYEFIEGLWMEQTRISVTYDALGRTIENILERYDIGGNQFFPQSRIQTFPRGNSLTQTDSVFTYNWSAGQNEWERIIALRNRFNAQNQLIEGETAISFSGQGFRSKDLYFYDAQGSLTRIENYSVVSGQFLLIGFTNHVFGNGLLRNTTSYAVVPPADSLPLSRTVNTYNEHKLISRSDVSTWDFVNKVWVDAHSTNYTYDTEKRVQSRIDTVIANGITQTSRKDFFYNALSDLIREETYIGTGEPAKWVLESKSFYYYDLASSLKDPKVSTRVLQISPNPSLEEIRLDLPSGAYFQVYNMAGQIQLSGKMNGQNRLDIRQWPKGLYLIVAQEGQLRWVGKVVKE